MDKSPQAPQRKARPGTVTFAVTLQILLALFLAVSSVLAFVYGPEADQAFEDELARQGFEVADLPENSARFDSGAAGLIMMLVVVAILLVLAFFNGAGNRVTRILTWVLQPLVLLCGGFIFAGQLFMAQFLQWGLDNSGDSDLEALDAQSLVDAAYDVYPSWTVVIDWSLVALATLGSLLIIILLAVPSANRFFRKDEPEKYIPGAPQA